MKFSPLKFSLLMLAACLLAPAAQAEAKFAFASTPGQLPKTVVPTRYVLTIMPDAQTMRFRGNETVAVTVLAPVKSIVLNALGLDVTHASLHAARQGQTMLSPSVKTDDAAQTLTLTFPATLSPGAYLLDLSFAGKMSVQSQGLYVVKYQTPAGKPKIMFGTQMEPTDARRMFPCWDEPAFRATFQMNALVPQTFMAVSNTPVLREQRNPGGLKTVAFATTPPMATYLVVLCAGEFESTSSKAAGVALRVVTTEGKKSQGKYALSVMEKILPYYNAYFGVKYPLPKLDLIAVPGGFQGAMENWGGIVYNENILLFDPKTSSERRRRTIFSVVSHETAHQWSGDLVTMAWWDNLWLNEGFASWMADKATDHFNPQWHVLEQAIADKDDILDRDAYTTTHPIQQPVADPTQAAAAFDEITYQKGEAVIRMFEAYLGEDVFEAGIQKYMAAHQYSNTTTADLWDALGQVSGKPMASIAAGWTEQPGFPVLLAKPAAGGVSLAQERFTVDTASPAPETWQVPVASQTLASTDRPASMLLTAALPVTVPVRAGSAVKLNAGNTGFYRVQYDPSLLRPLAASVETFAPADRIGLLGDTWALAKAGRVPVTDYLDLSDAARADTNLAAFQKLLGALNEIGALERGTPGQAVFDAYLRGVLRPRFDVLGWDAKLGEDSDASLLRPQLIRTLGRMGDPAVQAEARVRFGAYVQDPHSLPGNLIDPVLSIIGHNADQATYSQIGELARKENNYVAKQRLYGAMADAIDPGLIQQTLALSVSPEIKSVSGAGEDIVFSIAYDAHRPDLAWDFVKAHMDAILGSTDVLQKMFFVPQLFEAFTDAAYADELEAYAKTQLPAQAAPQIAKTAARIRFNSALKKRLLPEVDAWIKARPAQ